MRIVLYFLIFILVCTLSVVFFAQNDQNVIVSYFVGQSEVPLAFVMVGCLIVGYLIGLASTAGILFKQKLKIKSSEKQLAQKNKELENLRSLPIRDDY